MFQEPLSFTFCYPAGSINDCSILKGHARDAKKGSARQQRATQKIGTWNINMNRVNSLSKMLHFIRLKTKVEK